jgi:GntR family transcriptional regulator, rspAB operon transcriptional repressor
MRKTAGEKPSDRKSVVTMQVKAYNYVKERIMNRDIKPGQYITDSQIAGELNVSRTPVREALRLLEHQGFLLIQPRRGWKIVSLSMEEINDIFEIKENLEGMLACKAADCRDDKKRKMLQGAMESMKLATEADDHEAWRRSDLDLHNTLFEMAGNPRASRIINDLNDQWYRVRLGLVAMQGRVQRSNVEHAIIVEKIIAGDGEEAAFYMRQHLHNLREELERVLVNMVLPFTDSGI